LRNRGCYALIKVYTLLGKKSLGWIWDILGKKLLPGGGSFKRTASKKEEPKMVKN